jgi:hypothetical protein
MLGAPAEAATLKLPDVAALDASAHRLDLLGRMGNDFPPVLAQTGLTS